MMPVRLVAATLGGYLLLGEPVRNALEGVGLVLLIMVVVAYIRFSDRAPDNCVTKEGEDDYLPVQLDSVRGMSSFELDVIQDGEGDFDVDVL